MTRAQHLEFLVEEPSMEAFRGSSGFRVKEDSRRGGWGKGRETGRLTRGPGRG